MAAVCDCGLDTGWHLIFCSHWAQNTRNEDAPGAEATASGSETETNHQQEAGTIMNQSTTTTDMPATQTGPIADSTDPRWAPLSAWIKAHCEPERCSGIEELEPFERESWYDTYIGEPIRAWAQQYVTRRAELVAQLEADPGWQQWVEEMAADDNGTPLGPWTRDDCVRLGLRRLGEDPPQLPSSVLPAWAVSTDAGWDFWGGDVPVMIHGPERSSGDFRAWLLSGVNVVVDPKTGGQLGDHAWFNEPVSVSMPFDIDDRITDWKTIADAAVVLGAVALDMRAANEAG